MNKEIYEKVKVIIANNLEVDENLISENAFFVEDLEADSLDIADLVMVLEDEFDIEIEDTQLNSILKVGDVVNYIEKVKEGEN